MTFYELVKALNICSPVILVIGVILGFCYYKSLDIVHKSVTWYLFLMLMIDFASRIPIKGGNNYIVLLFYSLSEMGLFTYFYFRFLFKAKHRLLILVCCAAFLYIIWEIVKFEITDSKKFQSYAKVADDFIIIILALSFFHERINIFKESKWDNFSLNAVILVFFSINLIFFLPFNLIINKSSGLQFYIWLGIVLTTNLFYSYLAYSIWRNGRTQKLSLSGSR